MMRSCWRPLFEKEEALPFIDAVERLADGLWPDPEGPPVPPILEGGEAGLALLYGYLALAWGREADRQACEESLLLLTRALATQPLRVQLFQGLSGVGWVCQHLSRTVQLPVALPKLLDQVDELLVRELERVPWPGHFDLVSGLTGIGLVGLERLPRPRAVALLERVFHHLAAAAQRDEWGRSWFSKPEWIGPRNRQRFPNGCFDFGLAHGQAGVIAFLSGVRSAEIEVEGADALISDTVRWLLAHRQKKGALGAAEFPEMVERAGQGGESRNGWCYGDLSVASALIQAGESSDVAEWKRSALDVARNSTFRTVENARVEGAALCHGAAGVGHLYNRLAQRTGDPVLRQAARFWLVRALEIHAAAPERARGLLEGEVGIALAFLAAVTTIEPSWDRLMLLS